MVHVVLHFTVPLLIAPVFFRDCWRKAALILMGTILVDLDHLLADPIYDPERCSIGFHPLHTTPAIAIYAGLFLVPFVLARWASAAGWGPSVRTTHLMGLGLLLHMALDGGDCLF